MIEDTTKTENIYLAKILLRVEEEGYSGLELGELTLDESIDPPEPIDDPILINKGFWVMPMPGTTPRKMVLVKLIMSDDSWAKALIDPFYIGTRMALLCHSSIFWEKVDALLGKVLPFSANKEEKEPET